MKQNIFLVVILLVSCGATYSHAAFASSTLKKFPSPSKAGTEEALRIFQAYYPDRKPVSLPWTSWGVPARDLDGTKYTKISSDRGIFQRTVTQQIVAFTELSRVYGEKQALAMIRDLPTVLAFDPSNFAPSLVELIKNFGDDEARAMVGRNPGLLAIKPYGPGSAETTNSQTMQFSYIISVTRPYGRVLLYGLLTLLSLPILENITGFHIRTMLLHI